MKLHHIVKRKTQELIWDYFWHNYQLPQICIDDIAPKNIKELPRIMEKICMPPYLGDNSFNDYSYLISLIRESKPKIVLELGTAHGNTVANICAESDAKVYTVNALPEQIKGNLVTYTLGKDDIGFVYRKYGYEDRVTQIYQNTKKINFTDWITPKTVDFAIIDACHDSDFVVNDFLKIQPALSDHALVLFHDTNPSLAGYLIDSYLGCMYLRKMGFNVKHILGSSWGIWSANDPGYKQSLLDRVKNLVHTVCGTIFFGNRERFIQAIRWFASGFFRGKFNKLESI
jgi:hypothetical protein